MKMLSVLFLLMFGVKAYGQMTVKIGFGSAVKTEYVVKEGKTLRFPFYFSPNFIGNVKPEVELILKHGITYGLSPTAEADDMTDWKIVSAKEKGKNRSKVHLRDLRAGNGCRYYDMLPQKKCVGSPFTNVRNCFNWSTDNTRPISWREVCSEPKKIVEDSFAAFGDDFSGTLSVDEVYNNDFGGWRNPICRYGPALCRGSTPHYGMRIETRSDDKCEGNETFFLRMSRILEVSGYEEPLIKYVPDDNKRVIKVTILDRTPGCN